MENVENMEPAKGKEQKSTQKTITSFFKPPAKTPLVDNVAGASSPSNRVEVNKFKESGPRSHKTPLKSVNESCDDTESQKTTRRRRKPNYVISEDEEEEEQPSNKKSKIGKPRPLSDDSDDDYVPSDRDVSDSEGHEEDDSYHMDIDVPESSNSKRKRPNTDGFRTPAKKRLDQFRTLHLSSSPVSATNASPIARKETGSSPGLNRVLNMLTPSDEKKKARLEDFKKRNDDRYAWLVDERDAQMRRPTDPDYDPRTLFIPPHAWKKFTAFETQFWQVKAAHWDTIVMFKKGKFYECYEKDADIAHQIFDWKLTDRVNMKMTGVPENSFDHWASQFVAKGYKVARVDQVETLIGKEMREKANGIKKKEDNIIRRELTAVLTTGTLVDSNLLSNDMSTYCMSLTEFNADSANPKFLVCFADTATADFKLSTFDDDIDRSVFETLLMQIKPRELIIEKGSLSKIALQMIKNNLSNPQLNFLASGHEFWDHDRTVLELETGGYFKESTPRELKSVIEQDGSLTALGGMISYLKTLKLDKELVSIGNFSTYDPVGDSGTLILDGKTLSNLEIFDNESDHTEAGTLFRLVNHCLSSCGKRLLKKWITHPLRNVKEINARLDAVEDLVRLTKLRDLLAKCLRSLPDMERIISRVHAGNCKVKDFIAVLQGFNDIFETVNEAKESLPDLKSVQLIELLSNGFPNALQEQLKYYESSFDQSESLEEGDIVINEGYDEIYDEANKAVELIEAEFESYRVKQERELRTKLVYKDVGKDLFQLETPSKIRTPDDWKLMSKTKAVNRYHTPRIQSLTRKFLEAKEVRENAKKEVRSRLYQKFDGKYAGWLSVIRNMSILDCLCSLTFCRLSMGSPVCRPQFAEGKQRVLDFEELRHPCIVSDVGKDFIPNDIALGSGEASMILLTGPNMGGKSTLLRQTCIAVIMAQIGCFVPASSCVISPFDRIFTRLGANDNIMSGQSTFMVELSETSRILKEATPNSLVVLDELGRGTSTFDGYAIAFSVLRHLLLETRCLGLFSTHYGMLTSEFMDNKLVSLSFMNFISDEENREVTFLYKLAKGACPKSFGMNVASMAGISSDIVDCADEVASSFEKSLRLNNIRDVSLHSVKMSRQADFASLWKTNQDVLLPLLQSL